MATPVANSIPLTGNALIDGLTQGSSWQFGGGAHVLTYSLNLDDVPGGGPWTATLTEVANQAIAAWAAVANITFVYDAASSNKVFQASDADLALTLTGSRLQQIGAIGLGVIPDPGFANTLLAGFGYSRGSYPRPEGDIFLDNNFLAFGPGTSGMRVVLHEIGHALGLKHTYDDGANGRPTFSALGIASRDTYMQTIMGQTSSGVVTPMLLDVLAIQHMYGANMSYRTGNDSYVDDYYIGRPYTIWDAGGIDTLDASSSPIASGFTIDLRPGSVNGTTAIAYGTTIENAIGNTGSNTIIGNDADNFIDGRGGGDTISGGLGNDTYVFYGSETITELANQGTDLVLSATNHTLAANVENLTLTGSGNISGTGNALNNVLTGNSGNNALAGGQGDDIYVVNNTGDVITESLSQGTDSVQSTVTYTLGGNVENLALIGGGDINGTGNTLNNTLTGNSGSNILDGGAGADTLIGGVGNDTYVIDASDTLVELNGQGIDAVVAGFTYTLGAEFENLTLAGSANINGTGNALENFILGNAGDNVIDGGGGLDTLMGGAGNDTYLANNFVVIVENLNGGSDTVQSSVSFMLPSNLENLTLTGSASIDGSGNSLANVIVGNAGDNGFNGGGGLDTLGGGAGNDTYFVHNAGVVIVENLNEGTDAVQSSVTVVLAANLENLTLTGGANINGTGNSLVNLILGNAGNNSIDGGGGLDTLRGGAGNDTYLVNNAGVSIVENLNEGIDAVQSSVTVVLAANVENLTLTGSANIDGTGNSLGNVLTGNGGANTLAGGAGDDVYNIDGSDTVSELSGEGIDTVLIAATYTLGANVENLTLTGSSNINGTGNASNNVLLGNAGINVLTGGLGDDTYGVNAGDVVVESSGEGSDTVQSSISYTLLLGTNLENLTLTGTADLTGTGDTEDNVLRGNAGANVLVGGGGDDTLLGGGGEDTVMLSQAKAAYAMQYAGGRLTLTSATDTTSVGTMETLHFGDAQEQSVATFFLESAKDSNGDGHADIFWRNMADGAVAQWLMDGFTPQTAGVFSDVPLEWQIHGTGDFNADGKADLLWRNVNDGQISFWLMDGLNILTAGVFGEVPLEWQIQGTADFDGDGSGDILWRNVNDGSVAAWLMDGFTVHTAGVIVEVPLEWQIQGTADFDGDGSGDILWRNVNDGSVAAWLMDGLTVQSGGVIVEAPLEWRVAETGDFDADGRSDILWRNFTDGSVAGWLMDGLTVQAGEVIVEVPLDWQIAETGDYNNDLRTDILWRHAGGAVAEWHMDGLSVQDGGVIVDVPNDWVIV
jgi:Ca2+-binding RTX toxin-like protein